MRRGDGERGDGGVDVAGDIARARVEEELRQVDEEAPHQGEQHVELDERRGEAEERLDPRAEARPDGEVDVVEGVVLAKLAVEVCGEAGLEAPAQG